MALIRGGIQVQPHVQSFADDAESVSGVTSYGTYYGHQPTHDLAVDCFVNVEYPEPGHRLCEFAIENIEKYRIDYLIFRQQIYNPKIAPYWRSMADRGSVTANHYDHVHLSFHESAPDKGSEEEMDPEIVDLLFRNAEGLLGTAGDGDPKLGVARIGHLLRVWYHAEVKKAQEEEDRKRKQ